MAESHRGQAGHRSAWREARVLIDAGRMVVPLHAPVKRLPASSTRRITVMPGFGAGDRSTWRYLKKFGHHVEGCRLGINKAGMDIRHTLADVPPGWIHKSVQHYRNEGAVPLLCQRMTERVMARFEDLGRMPLTLIGWSLGGVVAREVARSLPDHMADVITLGTSVRGGPKYTRAAGLFRRPGMDLDLIERSTLMREKSLIRCRVTAITSLTDGVVSHHATIDRSNPDVRRIEIDASHIGLCLNPSVWRIITDTLHGAR